MLLKTETMVISMYFQQTSSLSVRVLLGRKHFSGLKSCFPLCRMTTFIKLLCFQLNYLKSSLKFPVFTSGVCLCRWHGEKSNIGKHLHVLQHLSDWLLKHAAFTSSLHQHMETTPAYFTLQVLTWYSIHPLYNQQGPGKVTGWGRRKGPLNGDKATELSPLPPHCVVQPR